MQHYSIPEHSSVYCSGKSRGLARFWQLAGALLQGPQGSFNQIIRSCDETRLKRDDQERGNLGWQLSIEESPPLLA
jgi:hypothetical protein